MHEKTIPPFPPLSPFPLRLALFSKVATARERQMRKVISMRMCKRIKLDQRATWKFDQSHGKSEISFRSEIRCVRVRPKTVAGEGVVGGYHLTAASPRRSSAAVASRRAPRAARPQRLTAARRLEFLVLSHYQGLNPRLASDSVLSF